MSYDEEDDEIPGEETDNPPEPDEEDVLDPEEEDDSWDDDDEDDDGDVNYDEDFIRESRGIDFADPGGRSALRAATRDNPRDCECPTCGTPDVLTREDVALGYQCNSCADQAEGGL